MGLKALCPHFPLGYGGLGLSIEGPSKVDINCEDMEDGTCKVTYCPTEPGTYIINIKFADKHVPGKALGRGWDGPEAGDEPSEMPGPLPPTGSPFTVKVTGEGRMKESITRRRQAPSIATIGSTCDLNLKIPGGRPQGPGGGGEPAPRCLSCRLLSHFLSLLPLPVPRRELVPDGVCPGAPDTYLHPQQPHVHPYGAHGDQQDAGWGDQARGAGGGVHSGWRRPLPRRLRGLPGPGTSGLFRQHHSAARG